MGSFFRTILFVFSMVYFSAYSDTITCENIAGINTCQCPTTPAESCTLELNIDPFLHLFLHSFINYKLNIDSCTGSSKNCRTDVLICRNDYDCTIDCEAIGCGCQGATITCPTNANCIVDCSGSANNCDNLVVNVGNGGSYQCLPIGHANCNGIILYDKKITFL